MAAATSATDAIHEIPFEPRENRVPENLSRLIEELCEWLKHDFSRDDYQPLKERAQPFLEMRDAKLVADQAHLRSLLAEFEAKLAYSNSASPSPMAEGSQSAGEIRESVEPILPEKRLGSKCCVAMISTGIATAAIAASILYGLHSAEPS